MNFQDIIKLEEQISINRRAGPDGIISVDNNVPLPVEFRVTRWESKEDWESGKEPYLVTRDGGSLAVLCGITDTGGQQMWKDLRADAGTTAFNNANSFTGTGDSTTAFASTQTDLQAATNKLRKGMDTGYPKTPDDSGGETRKMIWRSTYGSTDANFSWQEFAIFNAAAAGTMVDRFVSNQGTKVSGQVWELTVKITLT